MNKSISKQLQRINTIVIALIFVSLIGYLISATATDFRWFPVIAITSSVLLVDMIIFSYLRTKNLFSFRIIFLVLTLLFHMGYSWIFIFNPGYSFEGMDFELMFDANLVFRSYIYSLTACLGVYLGIQLGDIRSTVRPFQFTKRLQLWGSKLIISQKFTEESYRNLGFVILLFTLPVRLFIDISKIGLGGDGNYLSTFSLEVNGYVSMLGDMSIIGIVLLIIYYRKNIIVSSSIMGLSIFYYILSMASGSRGAAVISIVILFFAYTVCVRRFRTVSIIAICVLGIILATYVTNIGLNRIDNAPRVDERFGTQSRFLQEFGGTQLTTILAMRLADGQVDAQYAFGETYVAALLTILPNLTPDYEKYIDNNNFQKKLNYPTIGGSYIAEMYYNFGYFALALAVAVGFALSRFEGLIGRFQVREQFILLAFSIFIARQALWWIRDTALVFPRHIVVGLIVMILLCLLLQKFGFIKVKGHIDKVGNA